MKITFENATIADAINKASRIAPTKGSAFDKAFGILLSADVDGIVSIRATNLEVFYHEVIDSVDVVGSGEWRLPSVLANGFFGKLPIGSGAQVVLEQNGTAVVAKSKRTTARLRLADATYYPNWDPFHESDLVDVPDLGARIQQVAWAADKGGTNAFSGIYLDGSIIAASDGIRIAIVPCEVPALNGHPVVVPATVFDPIMRTLRDVSLGLGDGELYLMPDASTQITATMLAEKYPPVVSVMESRGRHQPNQIDFTKSDILDMIERAMVFAGNTRMPLLKIIIGRGEVAVMMTDAEENLLGDVIEVADQADHARSTILITPANLTDALRNAPSEKCSLYYDATDPQKPLRVDGGSGYEVLVMPRRAVEGEVKG